MNNICKCCGEKIGNKNIGWDYITIEGTKHKICGDCVKKIMDYKQGANLLNDIITVKTEECFINYIKNLDITNNT